MLDILKKRRASARVENGALYAAFDVSMPPMVWRLDLKQTPNFGVVLKPQGDGWALCVERAPDAVTPIAHFGARDDAEEAYGAVRRAILCGPARSVRIPWRWIVGGLVLGLLFLIARSFLFTASSEIAKAVTPPAQTLERGVPMTADDFLLHQQR